MQAERKLTPGQEGSEEAISVLLLLHKTRDAGGCSLDDLIGLLGMQKQQVQHTLKGLWNRGRVRSDGHGMGARWRANV